MRRSFCRVSRSHGLARARKAFRRSGPALCWWLVCPVTLFAYSRIAGNGVLIMRYASLMLPGRRPDDHGDCTRLLSVPDGGSPWRSATGAVALAFLGQWNRLWPAHEQDDWRDAAALERTIASAGYPGALHQSVHRSAAARLEPRVSAARIPLLELPLLPDPGRHEAVAVRIVARVRAVH